MHHWTLRTCDSFTPKFKELAREFVAREAFRHTYLMDLLLAVTGLHIATESENTIATKQHLSAALQYQNRGVAELSNVLENLSPDNINAVVLSSIFVMICAVLSSLLQVTSSSNDDNNEEIVSIIDVMMPLVRFVRGSGAIVMSNRQWLLQGPLRDWYQGPGSITISPDKPFPSPGYQILEKMVCTDTDVDYPSYSALCRAIKNLEDSYYKGKSMLLWLSTAEAEFLEELNQSRSAALAIFMYWGVLLDHADNMWWAHYAGRRFVEDVATMLENREEKWKELTHWCRDKVN